MAITSLIKYISGDKKAIKRILKTTAAYEKLVRKRDGCYLEDRDK